jgi:hypothetical protein
MRIALLDQAVLDVAHCSEFSHGPVLHDEADEIASPHKSATRTGVSRDQCQMPLGE